MPTLYRKYRPQTFLGLTGQNHIVQTIVNEIKSDKVAHAYLFSGPRGVGKTTVARLLAKAINCEKRAKGEFEPCNECASCTEITAGRNIDVMEVDAASHTRVEEMRENILESVQFKPTKSKFKVFIIDEVHMLSSSSFNALLKTLEEPPSHVIFILATTELHKLPATIISRCQRFAFQKIAFAPMIKRLEQMCVDEKTEVDRSILERIASKSDGCLRDAESLLGQILSLNLSKVTPSDVELILPAAVATQTMSLIASVIDKDIKSALSNLSAMLETGVSADQIAHDLIEMLRALMMFANADLKITSEYSDETVSQLKKLARQAPSGFLVFLIDRILTRKQEIKSAPIPSLPLELWIVEVCASTDSPVVPQPTATKEVPVTAARETPPAVKPEEPKPTTITQSIKSAISSITHHSISTPLEKIQKFWPAVVSELDTSNHSLTFVLKMCELISTQSGSLHITVPYSFHKEKLDDKKNKKLIEDCLSRLCGERVALSVAVAEGDTKKSEPDVVTTAAAEFGGEVISE